MKTQGIRIWDKNSFGINVDLTEILKMVVGGEFYHWSILFLDVIGFLGEGRSNPDFANRIFESAKGFFISWEDLNLMATKCEQVIDITIIGCKDKKLLVRYDEDQQMYETCDIVIEMLDSTCWEIFSKDDKIIQNLAKKFKKTELLEYDLQS